MKIFKTKLPFIVGEMINTYIQNGAIILDCQLQFGDPTVWFECDPEAEIVSRKIFIAGTGYEIPAIRRYISTFQDGSVVWHIYDCGEAE